MGMFELTNAKMAARYTKVAISKPLARAGAQFQLAAQCQNKNARTLEDGAGNDRD